MTISPWTRTIAVRPWRSTVAAADIAAWFTARSRTLRGRRRHVAQRAPLTHQRLAARGAQRRLDDLHLTGGGVHDRRAAVGRRASNDRHLAFTEAHDRRLTRIAH